MINNIKKKSMYMHSTVNVLYVVHTVIDDQLYIWLNILEIVNISGYWWLQYY
jgi:hypothetical protein